MKNGGYAFATASNEGYQSGMALRDYFAGQALVKVATATSLDVSSERIAEWCYKLADAMLAEREKENG
jgi:hypothetical protein